MPVVGWRWVNVFSAFPSLIFVMLSFWLPESTRYLVITGRHDEATYQLEQAASMNKTQLPDGKLEKTLENEVTYIRHSENAFFKNASRFSVFVHTV